MDRDPRIDALAASDLSSAAILAALIGALGAKGILADAEVREVYEQALYLLETHQGDEPETRPIYEAAREIIEAQLRQAPITLSLRRIANLMINPYWTLPSTTIMKAVIYERRDRQERNQHGTDRRYCFCLCFE